VTATALALLLWSLPTATEGAPPAAARPDLDASFRAAQEAYQSGDYAGSMTALESVVAEMERDPARPFSRDQWTRVLLRLAQVEATLGRGPSARAAMERALAVEPDLAADPEQYSPRFRRELELARARLALAPRFRLEVSAGGIPAEVRIDGLSLGDAPTEVLLPAGRYRLEVRSAGEARSARVDLASDERLTVDLSGPPPFPATGPAAEPRLSAAPAPSSAGLTLRAEAPVGWMRPTAGAAGGLAAAAAGLAVWQGIAAGNASAEASAMLLPGGMLRPGTSPAEYASATSSFDSARRNAWIAGGSAAALACGAVLLWVLAPDAPVTPAPAGMALRF
jgi:hypothetical protein